MTSSEELQTYPNYDVTQKKLKSETSHFLTSQEQDFLRL